MDLSFLSSPSAGFVPNRKRERDCNENEDEVNEHKPHGSPNFPEDPWGNPPSPSRADPDPYHFDIEWVAERYIKDIQGYNEALMWICDDGDYLRNEAPPVIDTLGDPHRKGAPAWEQSLHVAVHVLKVLLNAARSDKTLPLVNIANYCQKLYAPLGELGRKFMWRYDRNLWDVAERSPDGRGAALRVMLEVSEFMCVTALFLDFGDGVMEWADKLFSEITVALAERERGWDPTHELKRMHTQNEWAIMNGIHVWFPQTWNTLTAYSNTYNMRMGAPRHCF